MENLQSWPQVSRFRAMPDLLAERTQERGKENVIASTYVKHRLMHEAERPIKFSGLTFGSWGRVARA